MANPIVEAGRKLSGETRRAIKALALLDQRSELVSSLPHAISIIVKEAAQRGSSRFLKSEHSSREITVGEKVANLMVDGGFIAVPYLPEIVGFEGGMRYHDATIIPMTTEAQNCVASLPQAAAYIGGFSHKGYKDTTGVRKEQFATWGIQEADLPTISYQQVIHVRRDRNLRNPYNIEVSFEYRLYYIPPGSERNLRADGVFRGSEPAASREIMNGVYGATGRELAERAVGAVRDPFRPVAPTTSSWKSSRYGGELNRKWEQEQRNYDARQQTRGVLDTEEQQAGAAIDPLIADMIAIGRKPLFAFRR